MSAAALNQGRVGVQEVNAETRRRPRRGVTILLAPCGGAGWTLWLAGNERPAKQPKPRRRSVKVILGPIGYSKLFEGLAESPQVAPQASAVQQHYPKERQRRLFD